MEEKDFQELVKKVGEETAMKIKSQFDELEKKQAAELQKATEGFVAKSVIEEMEKKHAEEFKKLDEVARKQGDAIEEMRTKGYSQIPSREDITFQIKSYLEGNKDKFDAFKRGETKAFGATSDNGGQMMAGIEIKAAATMTVGGNTNSSAFVPAPEVVPGLVDLARNRPFIEQYANTSGTSRPRIVWAEKTNPDGNAAFIDEGGVKPLIDFEIVTHESYAKKVADKIKVSTEMLDDIDFIAAEIEKELKYKVDILVDTELLSGAGDGTSGATTLKGLTAYVGAYTTTGISVAEPSDFDAIRSAAAQIVSLNFLPDTVFVNPIDGANMDMTKNNQGSYISMNMFNAQGQPQIYRMRVIETNQMPVGHVLVGDMSRFKVRNYKPFAIYYGWVNDDFEKNLVTIIGERRLHSYVATNEVGAFAYDSFANIKTAIDAGV